MEVELAASVAVPFSSQLDTLLRSTGLEGMKVKAATCIASPFSVPVSDV